MKSAGSIVFLIGLFISVTASAENYQQACRVLGEDDYVQYQIEAEMPLRPGASFNLKLTAFEDENCTIPYLQYNQYFLVMNLESEKLNLKTQKITYASLSDEVSEALSLMQYCGIAEWQTNFETGVTGQICDNYPQLAFEQTLFQIFKQTENSFWIGKIGFQKNGRDESQRPDQWDELEFSLNLMSQPIRGQ